MNRLNQSQSQRQRQSASGRREKVEERAGRETGKISESREEHQEEGKKNWKKDELEGSGN